MCLNFVWDSTFENRNLDKILLCSLYAFGDSSCNLTSLTQSITYSSVTVADNDNRCKSECTTTLCYLCHTVDSNETIFQFYVTVNFYFIHCHNRLKFKTALASSFCELLHTAVVKITITVKYN